LCWLICAALLSPHLLPNFLAASPIWGLTFYLQAYVKFYLGGESVGTTMSNLNHTILSKMPIPLPPLAEQRRIVAKLDEILPLCERLK